MNGSRGRCGPARARSASASAGICGMRCPGGWGSVVCGMLGVMSYSVARQTREFGVRLSLGAERHDVTRMVLGRAVLAGSGAALGLIGAALLTRVMETLLYGVKPSDPVSFASAAATLVG